MAELTDTTDIRETVRERYASAARAAVAGRYDEAAGLESEAGCCATGGSCGPPSGVGVWGAELYDEASREGVPDAAVNASLGCGVGNVEFVKGYLEDMPLADESVDVVISNCVINLSADKPKTIREAARVLRPGGRLAISDVIADPDMDDATKSGMAAWTGCIAGALTEAEFRTMLQAAGLDGIEIVPTHQVHAHASSAIVRARKPSGCCAPKVQEACCEPSAKTECCGSEQHAAGTCGCV